MTIVYLDDDRLDIEEKDGPSTVGELIDALAREVAPHKMVVTGVVADGERRDDWTAERFRSAAMADFGEIRILTDSVESIALHGVATCIEYLEVITGLIGEVVERLRSGEEEEALTGLSKVFVDINELVRTIEALDKVRTYDIRPFQGEPSSLYGSLEALLQELRSAQQSGDMVLMADLLEYEISPLLDKLEEALRAPGG
ncbi:MAG TPA: hypothetical protein ENJ37_03920 [Deltaproteobacteria bacterium]|nr:hypothetical protein [Deltaproteobacteria bacterium]